jgi:hypothetical protein
MGNKQSSQSAVTQTSNQLVINQTDIDIVNQQMNNVIVNTIVTNAQSCSATINNNQNIILKGLSGTDINITTNQTQQAVLDFKCVNASTVTNDSSISMLLQIVQNLQQTNTTDILTKLNAAAASSAQSQFQPTFASNTKSNSNLTQSANYQSFSQTHMALTNLITNTISHTFTTNNVSNCLTSAIQNQTVEVYDIKAQKTINAVISQDQGVQLITNCVNTSGVASKMTNGIASELGLTIQNTNATSTNTGMEGTSESSALQKGILESVGTLVQNIGTAIGNLLSGLLGFTIAGIAAPFVISFLCICLCLFCCLISVMKPSSSGSGSGSGSNIADID